VFPDSARIPLCRVGERIFLSAASATDRRVATIAYAATRQMDITAGETELRLHQLPPQADIGLPPEDLPHLDEFLDIVVADPVEQFAALRSLFGTAMLTFPLRADPIFMSIATTLADEFGQAAGTVHFDMVEGFDTVLATIPSRSGFRGQDLLVSLSGAQLSMGRVASVREFLARDNPRQRLAAISFSGAVAEGRYLFIGHNRLMVVETKMRRHSNLQEFYGEYPRRDQDLVSLLAGSDDDAAVLLNRLGRQDKPRPVLDEPVLGVHFALEDVIPLPDGLFVHGWLHDPDGYISAIFAVDHSLETPEISSCWKLFSGDANLWGKDRPAKRFVAFLSRQAGARSIDNVAIRLVLSNGETHLLSAAPVTQELFGRRQRILRGIAGHAFTAELLQTVFMPALMPLQQALNAQQSVHEVRDYGRRSSRSVSLIIPLYRETGFFRSQLMAFSVDPYVRDHCEIVYVLDDPVLSQDVASLLEGYALTYPLDLRLVVLERNGGYAMANNMGVSQAEGAVIVLMNSDVIPAHAGWLAEAVEKLQSLPDFSVLGPKLVYADGSLQHAGMYFHRLSTGFWQNFHFWKGYGADFAPANRGGVVPAVTGACMIIRKADYLAVGGFTSDYAIGDYEDSDLCLKLRDRGGLPYYLPSIVLHHFERQSMPDSNDRDLGSTVYNRALHTLRWNDRILEANKAMDFALAE
jgi:GT2 family glycosyltransferase